MIDRIAWTAAYCVEIGSGNRIDIAAYNNRVTLADGIGLCIPDREVVVQVDCIAVSGGWSPTVALTCHHRGRPKWREDIAGFLFTARGYRGVFIARRYCVILFSPREDIAVGLSSSVFDILYRDAAFILHMVVQ